MEGPKPLASKGQGKVQIYRSGQLGFAGYVLDKKMDGNNGVKQRGLVGNVG